MYEQQFPEVGDVVIVQVRSTADVGAYVSLLEYNNIEGLHCGSYSLALTCLLVAAGIIPLSEFSRRRIRSINKLVKVGGYEKCVVLPRGVDGTVPRPIKRMFGTHFEYYQDTLVCPSVALFERMWTRTRRSTVKPRQCTVS